MSSSHRASRQSVSVLTLGAIGVVYGDIGTSPLYAFREALAQSAEGGIDRLEIIGVLSLALWALILVVTLKYVFFLTRMDNQGEGGVLSLTALAHRATSGKWLIVTLLGSAGAALFYGDAIITPALSVLSAVEGLKTVPGVADWLSLPVILGVTIGILVGLCAMQWRGTAHVARLFVPICALWFIARGKLGPALFAALAGATAYNFFLLPPRSAPQARTRPGPAGADPQRTWHRLPAGIRFEQRRMVRLKRHIAHGTTAKSAACCNGERWRKRGKLPPANLARRALARYQPNVTPALPPVDPPTVEPATPPLTQMRSLTRATTAPEKPCSPR